MKTTRVACNDDKVIFESPLNWTTRSFIFAKQGSTNMGLLSHSDLHARNRLSSSNCHHNCHQEIPEKYCQGLGKQ